jgi:putative membrane protein
MGWATIPITTVVAFTFMGIEGIAEEIEMPFGSFCLILLTIGLQRISFTGTDDCDLPLGQVFISPSTISKLTSYTDRYCQDLKEEIEYVFNLAFSISPSHLL